MIGFPHFQAFVYIRSEKSLKDRRHRSVLGIYLYMELSFHDHKKIKLNRFEYGLLTKEGF